MAKHSVNVLIKAKDEASRKFLTIGGAAKVMGKAFKGAAGVAKKTLAKAFKIVKKAVLGLAAAFAYSLYVFGKYESAMRKATAVSNVTEGQFRKMSKMARAEAIRLNISATDAAQAFYFLGSAGLSASEQIEAFPSVATMTKAATIDMGQAAEMLVDTMKGFKIPFTEAGRVTDVLAKSVTSSNMTFDQLGEALADVSGLAGATNNILEETVAMIATMADVGIKGSKAGIALRRSMLNLAAPTSEIRKELQKHGVAIYDSNQKMKPFIQIVGELSEKLRNASEEQRNMAFSTLFGARAVVGQLAIFDKGREALNKFTHSLVKSGGAAQEIADKQLNSLSEQFGRLRKMLADVAIEINEAASPAYRMLIKDLQDSVKSSGEFVKRHREDIHRWASKTVTAVILVKDMFVDFANYMKEDWRGALSFVFDSFLELMKAAFKTAITMSIAVGKGIKKGMLSGYTGDIHAETSKRFLEEYPEAGRELTVRGWEVKPHHLKSEAQRERYEEIRSQVEKETVAKQVEGIIGNSLKVIEGHYKDAAKKIAENTPKELGKAWEESKADYKKRLKELLAPPGKQSVGAGGAAGVGGAARAAGSIPEAFKEAVSRAVPKLAFKSAGFTTFAPGKRFGTTEQNTKMTAETMKKGVELMKKGISLLERITQVTHPHETSVVKLLVSNFK